MRSKLTFKTLGMTGIEVTEFCLGLLPMSPLQADLPDSECVKIIRKAVNLGVNFFDTAESYGSQPYMGKALQDNRDNLVIATKSTAETYDDMASSVERSLNELQTDYIDIYHLHGARPSIEIFEQRKGALQRLVDLKQQKVIRAVGVATHNVNVVKAAAERDDVDILYVLVNKKGMGILGGSTDDMVEAIKKAADHGKGLYVMKALAGGNLVSEYHEALEWARGLEGINSVSVGIVSEKELLQNLKQFGLKSPETDSVPAEINIKNKKLFILERLCTGCERCVEACPNDALYLEEEKAKVDRDKCILCGYCSNECPEFLIRLV